ARFFALLLLVSARAPRRAHDNARELASYCATHDAYLLDHFNLLLGWSEVYAPNNDPARPFGEGVDPEAGTTSRGLQRMATALTRIRGQLGQALDFTRHAAQLIEAQIDAGQIDEARALFADADAYMRESDERYLESELARLAARLHLAGAPPSVENDDGAARPRDARGWFAHALAVAARQEAHALALRVALDFDRFADRLGCADAARSHLRAIYDRFDPTDRAVDSAELRAARRQLAAAAAPR
ncbi:MAG: hypothetical protein AAF772_05575, partial [Acidobacteriota bacterium]